MEPQSLKILIADDEPDILEFLGYNLRKEGFTVLSARNGAEAVKVARDENPDLIILDIMMPEMDGIDACQTLRQDPALKDVFVMFLTARGEDYSQVAGFESGADDYVKKPVKPQVLISRIRAMMRRKMAETVKENTSSYGGLVIDKDKY